MSESCKSCEPMLLSEELKRVVSESPFVALATMSKAGEPHLIVVGKAKEIQGDLLVFGVYKMNVTRQNIDETGVMQVAVVSGKSGFRLCGKACVKGGEVHFAPEKAESLL